MRDEQIEAAAMALVDCLKLSEAKWADLPDWAKEECRGFARAALEAAEAVAWQPIETLEFNDPVRTNVLLWHEPSRSSYVGHRTSNGFWSNSHKSGSRFMPPDGQPTHYLNLPEPPK